MTDKDPASGSEDTLAPMPHKPTQPPTAGRRGTVMAAAGAAGPRRSIAGGMLNRATLLSLSNLANSRRSKAQEVRLENTYRMVPKPDERLRCGRLKPILTQALTEALANYEYSATTAPRRACDIAQTIRNRAKEAGFDRYKFVVFVAVLERRPGDSACLASRALWTPGECGDNFVEAQFDARTARGHATLHALYYE